MTFDGPVPDLAAVAGVARRDRPRPPGHPARCAGRSGRCSGVLAAAGVSELRSREPSLEELFLTLYGDGGPTGTRRCRLRRPTPSGDPRPPPGRSPRSTVVLRRTARRGRPVRGPVGLRVRRLRGLDGVELLLALPHPGPAGRPGRRLRLQPGHHRPLRARRPCSRPIAGFTVLKTFLTLMHPRRRLGAADQHPAAPRRGGRRPLGAPPDRRHHPRAGHGPGRGRAGRRASWCCGP